MLTALLFSNCSVLCSKSTGAIISKEINLNLFNSLTNNTLADITIKEGLVQKITITGNEDVINEIMFLESNNTLEIDLEKEIVFCNKNKIKIDIVIPNIVSLKSSGNSNINLVNFSQIENLTIISSGNGDVSFNNVSVKNCNLSLSGNGNFNGFSGDIINCTVKISGNGDCEANVKSNLDASISGNGTVYFKGNPIVKSNVSGNGELVNAN